ncbi:Actin cortical patch SUR7/pH-response regulator PalI [Phaffia rhodozyma]|uniref:Actin cortical patch SUR7/pH-response regulator PalI n=1 Tax=Phaffia rhodozyma TaxID=264483 RepID=A0A0F7SUY7_PHARH|nr:Actin cortical patch SUR7/pH-response regulator PalI [Phaffia rhodozyma]
MYTTYRQSSFSSSPFRVALSLILHLALVILLIFPTFSAPFLKSFYFIRTASSSSATVYGAFGSCTEGTGGKCTSFKVGWDGGDIFAPQWLISAMVTWLPAFGLSIITLLVTLPALFRRPIVLGLWRILDFFTSLATSLSFGFTLSLMIRAKAELKAAGYTTSSYGSALWIGAAALGVSILISFVGPPIIVRAVFESLPTGPGVNDIGYVDHSQPRGFVGYEGSPAPIDSQRHIGEYQEQEQEPVAGRGGWFARFDRKKRAQEKELEREEQEKSDRDRREGRIAEAIV